MPFTARWTKEAQSQYEAIQAHAAESLRKRKPGKKTKSSKAEGLFKQVDKCVRLLLENPKHPGLQTHAFHSLEHPYDMDQKVFEAYVQNRTPGAYRLFWCYGPGNGEITIIAITPHP
jgi:hypothetical protein